MKARATPFNVVMGMIGLAILFFMLFDFKALSDRGWANNLVLAGTGLGILGLVWLETWVQKRLQPFWMVLVGGIVLLLVFGGLLYWWLETSELELLLIDPEVS